MWQELAVGGDVGDQIVEVRRWVGKDASCAEDGFWRVVVTTTTTGRTVVEGGGGGGDGGEEPGGVRADGGSGS